jgi:hypothetical protein
MKQQRKPENALRDTAPMVRTVCGWYAFAVAITATFFSDHDESGLLTLGAAANAAGMWCLYCRIKSGRGMVSRRMLEHLLLMFVCRTTCTSLYSGYLPIDCSGDYAYQLFDLSGLLAVCAAIKESSGMIQPKEASRWNLAAHCAALAYLSYEYHFTLNEDDLMDALWAFSTYSESTCYLYQLHVEQYGFAPDVTGGVDAATVWFTRLVMVNRVLTIHFWCRGFTEESDELKMLEGAIPFTSAGFLMILFLGFSLVTVSQMFFKIAFVLNESSPKSKSSTSRLVSDGDKSKRKPRRGLKGEDGEEEEEGKQDASQSIQRSVLTPSSSLKELWKGAEALLHVDALQWNRPTQGSTRARKFANSGASPALCVVFLWVLLSQAKSGLSETTSEADSFA